MVFYIELISMEYSGPKRKNSVCAEREQYVFNKERVHGAELWCVTVSEKMKEKCIYCVLTYF